MIGVVGMDLPAEATGQPQARQRAVVGASIAARDPEAIEYVLNCLGKHLRVWVMGDPVSYEGEFGALGRFTLFLSMGTGDVVAIPLAEIVRIQRTESTTVADDPRCYAPRFSHRRWMIPG
jgi:hypothetical protein